MATWISKLRPDSLTVLSRWDCVLLLKSQKGFESPSRHEVPMKKTKVNADEVRRHREALRKVNRIPIESIQWVNDKGKTLPFPQEVIDNWAYTGLNNSDFVEVVIDGNDKKVSILLIKKK